MNYDEEDFESFSREQALAIAETDALRDLVVSETSIRYVAFLPDFHDTCLCEFVQEGGGWIKTIRLLTNAERLPEEEIQDSQILKLLREGNRLSAVRLYRAKYEVGLREAVQALEAWMQEA